MIRRLITTNADHLQTLVRLILGVVFFAHGAQKMLGWFGGYGFAGTMGFFTHMLHIPAPLAVVAIAAEFFGGLGLLIGLWGRVAAFGVLCNMVVAILMVHLPNGFFVNWFGNQKGEGIEFHLLAIALAASVLVKGSGAWSLDRALARRSSDRSPLQAVSGRATA